MGTNGSAGSLHPAVVLICFYISLSPVARDLETRAGCTALPPVFWQIGTSTLGSLVLLPVFSVENRGSGLCGGCGYRVTS